MLASRHFNIHGPMTCGSAEAESRVYKLCVSKTGKRYLVAVQENEGDNIYVEGRLGSQGFGGRELTFTLVCGKVLKLVGPWHTNSDDLFEATGCDVREKHRTQGIIALRRERGDGEGNLYKDVLHYDDKPVVGCFDRIKTLAQELADERGEKVWYAVVSSGGGSSGCQWPERKEQDSCQQA